MYLELNGWWKNVWWLVQCCKWDQWDSCCWEWDIQWHIKPAWCDAPVPDVHRSRPGDLPSDRPSILDLTTNLNNRRFQRDLPPWPPQQVFTRRTIISTEHQFWYWDFQPTEGERVGGRRVIREGREYNFCRWIYFYNPRRWPKVVRYTKAVWKNMMVVTMLCHDSPNTRKCCTRSPQFNLKQEIAKLQWLRLMWNTHTHQYSFYYCFCFFIIIIIFKRVSCCRGLPVFSPGYHCQT